MSRRAEETETMRLLLHICCGPCASGSIPAWRAKGADVVGFFANPNIHPFLEFRRRLAGTRDVAELFGVPLVVDDSYDPEAWFRAVAGKDSRSETTRCARCMADRLERAAHAAVEQGCNAFSTTLSISPWQDHAAIAQAGTQAGDRHGVEFIYEDLRPYYRESCRYSRENGIYRQKYCGCLVSEWERYRDR